MRRTSLELYNSLIIFIFLMSSGTVYGAEYHGLISFEDYYSNDSSSAYDFNFLTTRIRLDADKLNSAGNLSFHFDGRERMNFGSKDYNRNIKNERIDTMNLEYTGIKPLYLAVGRLWPRELFIERVDGVNLVSQWKNLGAGFFGGTKPDPYTEALNSDFTAAGGYLFYRKEELFANLAYTYNGYKGRTDREYIYGQSSFSPLKQVRLYGSMTVDIKQFEESVGLTNAVAEITYRPDYRKGVSIGYNQFRAYKLYRSMDFAIDESLQQLYYINGDYRLNDRYTLYGRYELQTLHYNAFEKEQRNSNIYQIGFRNDNLLNQHIRLDANLTLADSFSSSYNTYNFHLSRFFGDIFQLSFNSSCMEGKYDLSGYRDNIFSYNISGYLTLNRRWNLSLSLDGRDAKDSYTNTLLSRISYSF